MNRVISSLSYQFGKENKHISREKNCFGLSSSVLYYIDCRYSLMSLLGFELSSLGERVFTFHLIDTRIEISHAIFFSFSAVQSTMIRRVWKNMSHLIGIENILQKILRNMKIMFGGRLVFNNHNQTFWMMNILNSYRSNSNVS